MLILTKLYILLSGCGRFGSGLWWIGFCQYRTKVTSVRLEVLWWSDRQARRFDRQTPGGNWFQVVFLDICDCLMLTTSRWSIRMWYYCVLIMWVKLARTCSRIWFLWLFMCMCCLSPLRVSLVRDQRTRIGRSWGFRWPKRSYWILRLENNAWEDEGFHTSYKGICVRVGSGVKFILESKF